MIHTLLRPRFSCSGFGISTAVQAARLDARRPPGGHREATGDDGTAEGLKVCRGLSSISGPGTAKARLGFSMVLRTGSLHFAAAPRFARGQSRISFDMLKSLCRV